MTQSLHKVTAVAIALVLLVTSCGTDTDRAIRLPAPETVTASAGFEITTVLTGLSGPTQAAFTDDGRLLVAQINGGENDQTGQIVAVDFAGAVGASRTSYEVVIADLDKPTGVAVIGNALWIMERRRLTVGPLDRPLDRRIVADELPWNGRSEGTLTATATGGLLYNTSGSKRGAVRVNGSGTIFEIEDASLTGAPYTSRAVATGFKHAYARVVTPDGALFAAEMSDGRFDGSRAVDEIVAVTNGDDGGWPFCVGNNRPVAEFADLATACAGVRPSHALFDAGATPTSLAIAPWDPDLLVVTLWIPGLVVTVPTSEPADGPWPATTFISGIESPQYLLPNGDELLIFDHETGTVFAVRAVV